MKLNFAGESLRRHMLEGGFGLEKESLRVGSEGCLSRRAHPFTNDKNLDRDFAESQTEFITDVFDSAAGACAQLESLHVRAYRILREKGYGEYFWPFSNPPHVHGDGDIDIANFEGERKDKSAYRQYLAQKYGKRKMLYSGVHFNFNLSEAFLRAVFDEDGGSHSSFEEFKENLYLDLSAKATKYSWLIVYLMSASPIFDGSFFSDHAEIDIVSEFSSARCGRAGYWNDFVPVLDYSSLKNYAASIQKYVTDGRLRSASELYCPMRIKPNGENSLENLVLGGVGHIEFRLLDLNPFSPSGVEQRDVEFLQLFFVYLLSLDGGEFGKGEQKIAVLNAQNGALLDDKSAKILLDGSRVNLRTAAQKLLDDMTAFFGEFADENVMKTLEYQRQKLCAEGKRYADIVVRNFGENYIENGVKLARSYARYFEEEAAICADFLR